MLVLHEGQIPYNPKGKSYKIGLLHGKEDIVYLDEIFNKGIKLLKYNKDSLKFIRKYSDKDTVYNFLYNVICQDDSDYKDYTLINPPFYENF